MSRWLIWLLWPAIAAGAQQQVVAAPDTTVTAALANLNVKSAYIDGELCGVDEAGLPSFAQTQAATDGERGVHLVYYAFDLLHINGWDVSNLELIKRKALLQPLVANKPGLQFNGHDTGDGELILKQAGKLGFEGVVSKTIGRRSDPRVQPNKASSKDERLPDLRTIVAATTLQSLARESLLASLARRQASACASPPKSEISAAASEEIASRSSCGRW